MHYFKRNIGDYAKKAGRLSMLQHGAYTLLLDACYDRERFPTLDEAIEWTWASTKEEEEAVAFVLRKFFSLEDGVYVQKRIQEEIMDYHGKAETNRRIAIERETKRRVFNTFRVPSVDDQAPNQEPRTSNQEPITNKEQKQTKTRANSANVFPEITDRQLVKDWLKVRTAKRLPVTDTAIEGFTREVSKSGLTLEAILRKCCEKGWGGFEAKWLEKDLGPPVKEKFDGLAYVMRNKNEPEERHEKVIN